jgi:hypothetical protein
MSLQIQVTADVAGASRQIQDFSKKATNTLTSLSLALQDLPFGFIGIQNNLPGIVKGFQDMGIEAKNGASVLSQLKNALIGPAGLYLAFSAVSFIVTKITLEYGSLGAALDALVGKTTLASKAQQDFNKALAEATGNSATEVAEIRILVAVLTDLSKPLKERQAAYVELKKIRPDVIAGQKLENISTEKATKLINENANAVLNLILLKAKEAAISSVLNKNAEELAKLLIEENDLKKRIAKSEKDYADNRKNSSDFDELSARLIEGFTKKLNNNKKEQEALNKVAQDYIKILDPTIKGIAEVDRRTNELTESIKKQKKEKVEGLGKSVFGEQGEAIESAMSLDQINKLLIANLKLSFGKNGIFTTILDRLLGERKNLIKKKLAEEAAILAPKKVSKIAGTPLSAELEAQIGAYQIYLAKLQEIQALLTSTFLQPLENAFMNLFETGKFGFKAFADAVLKQIQQLVAKIIATGIISLIANLASGGFAGVGGAAKGFGAVGQSILSAIGLGVKKTANPSFGGVGPGGLGMSGQVNVVLRGSDLVGALNRTNATINRVG